MKQIFSLEEAKPNTWYIAPNNKWIILIINKISDEQYVVFPMTTYWKRHDAFIETIYGAQLLLHGLEDQKQKSLSDFNPDIFELIYRCETYEEFRLFLGLQLIDDDFKL